MPVPLPSLPSHHLPLHALSQHLPLLLAHLHLHSPAVPSSTPSHPCCLPPVPLPILALCTLSSLMSSHPPTPIPALCTLIHAVSLTSRHSCHLDLHHPFCTLIHAVSLVSSRSCCLDPRHPSLPHPLHPPLCHHLPTLGCAISLSLAALSLVGTVSC